MELLAMAIVSGLIWVVTPSKTYYNTQFNQAEVTQEAQKACGADGFIIYPKGFLHDDKVMYFKCKAKDS